MVSSFKKAVIIGRFQPFHFGHLYLLNEVKKIAQKVILVLGSANVLDEDNPFDVFFRKKMIEKVIKKENLTKLVNSFVESDDFFDDETWFLDLKSKLGDFDILVGNNQWVNSIFQRKGYRIVNFPFYNREIFEGLSIRKLMKKNQSWMKFTPSYLWSMIRDYQQKKRCYFDQKFTWVVVGGSFDHFHKGHQILLKTALKHGKKIIVGITSQEMIKDKPFFLALENFFQRKRAVFNYLKKNKGEKIVTIKKIDTIFGGEEKTKKSQAIICSPLTLANVLFLNKNRRENGLLPLFIIKVKKVLAEDGKIISSERIRKGEIDRKGRSYEIRVGHFWKKKKFLKINEELKEKLRQPLGKVFLGKENQILLIGKKLVDYIKKYQPVLTIAVGDIICYSLLKNQFVPSVQIIDYQSRKKELPTKIKNILKNNFHFKIVNQRGSLNFKTFMTIKKAVKNFLTKNESQKIFVKGEEDLLVLPAIIFFVAHALDLYRCLSRRSFLIKI